VKQKLVITLNGYYIAKSPRDLTLISYPISEQVAAGITRVISFPNIYNGFARGVVISNRDGANAAFIRINGITSTQIRIPPSGSFAFNDQWVSDLQIVAGAAGITDVVCEVVPRGQN
jgi:hypothetical protein